MNKNPSAVSLGKRGHKKFLKLTTEEQRKAWVRKGGEVMRKYWENRKDRK